MLSRKPYYLNKTTISLIVLGMLVLTGVPMPVFGYVWEQRDVNTNSVSGCELPYIIHSPAQPGRFLFGNRGITDDAGETARPIDLPPGYYQFDRANPDGIFRVGYFDPLVDSSLISLEYTADLGSIWTVLLIWEGSFRYGNNYVFHQSSVDPNLIYMVNPPIDMGFIEWEDPFLLSRDHGLTWDTLYFETYYVPLRTSIYDIIPSPIDTNTALFTLYEEYFDGQIVFRLTHDAGETFSAFSADSMYITSRFPIFCFHLTEPESLFGFITKPLSTNPYLAVASDDTVLGEYDSVALPISSRLGNVKPAWFEGRFGLYYNDNGCGGYLQDTLRRFIWPDIHDYKAINIPTFHNAS